MAAGYAGFEAQTRRRADRVMRAWMLGARVEAREAALAGGPELCALVTFELYREAGEDIAREFALALMRDGGA